MAELRSGRGRNRGTALSCFSRISGALLGRTPSLPRRTLRGPDGGFAFGFGQAGEASGRSHRVGLIEAIRIALLTAFTEAIAAGQPDRFKPAVRAASEGGADRDALFVAVDVAHVLAQVPAHVVAHAYATIHAWHWIVARRAVHQRVVVDQAA